jgi:thiF family protein
MRFSRTELLIGKEGLDKLKSARIAVFGIGGVGAYVAEALARSGVGSLDLIDNDTVDISNINRQLIALTSTVGRFKTEVMRERINDINSDCRVYEHRFFYLPENRDEIDFTKYDYIVDAVDTISAKIDIIVRAKELDIPVISSMGAGNKLNPADFEVADIYDTSVCKLAKVMRRELKARGVTDLKVVYSKEINTLRYEAELDEKSLSSKKRSIPASIAFVPPVVGLIIASEVVKDIIRR